MKRIFTILTTLFLPFYFCQNNKCKLKIDFDSSTVKNDGNIKILVKNIGSQKSRIIRSLDPYKAQILNVSVYSPKENKYISQKSSPADIDFLLSKNTEKLKPNVTKTYVINIFETYQGIKYLNPKNNYHFDLFFDLFDFKFNCEVIGEDKLSNLKYEPN